MVGFEEMRDELLERIEDLLKRKQYTALRDLLADLAPADIASLFEDLDDDSIPILAFEIFSWVERCTSCPIRRA